MRMRSRSEPLHLIRTQYKVQYTTQYKRRHMQCIRQQASWLRTETYSCFGLGQLISIPNAVTWFIWFHACYYKRLSTTRYAYINSFKKLRLIMCIQGPSVIHFWSRAAVKPVFCSKSVFSLVAPIFRFISCSFHIFNLKCPYKGPSRTKRSYGMGLSVYLSVRPSATPLL
jgi:hypothetical protein